MTEPRLSIHLEADANGTPKFVAGQNHKHYNVVFEIEDAPADAYAAIYELDPSYYDPIQIVERDDNGRFQLKTTTFGDFPLVVRLRRETGEEIVLKAVVARALRREAPPSPAFEAALGEIARY